MVIEQHLGNELGMLWQARVMIGVCDGHCCVMVLRRSCRCSVVRFRWCYSLLLGLLLSVIDRVLLQCQALVVSMLCRGGRRHLLLLLLAFNLSWRALEFVTNSILIGRDCASGHLMVMMLLSVLLIHLLLIAITIG